MPLLEKFDKRIAKWKGKTLSKEGRLVGECCSVYYAILLDVILSFS